MICPSCGSEYREGFTRCAECDVDLVETITAERQNLAPLTLESSGELVAELTDRPRESRSAVRDRSGHGSESS
jgi:hypothetical protein